MANEGGKVAQKSGKAGRDAKRAERAAKRKAGGGKEKEKNPVLQQARERYSEELKKQGLAGDQMKTKLKAHLKEVVKPAMNEAKAGAKSKNLKGAERRKYVQDAVRTKLGL
ncbi:MAG: hypothetical protein JO208_07365 [Alphaproteobacteria bacterium]|nr:hypothetical protein [Alphaproteobacteria bacterium]